GSRRPMSLLMDALKKAELAKRQGLKVEPTASPENEPLAGLTLEPIPASETMETETGSPATENVPSASTLPHLPPHLEELEDRFLAEATQAATTRLKKPAATSSIEEPPVGRPLVESAEAKAIASADIRRKPSDHAAPPSQAAAQNLFAAKQPEKPASRKTFTIAIGVITFLSVCGIGGYFWWQLQPKTTLSARLPAAQAPRPITPPPSAPAPIAVSPAPTLEAAPAVAPNSPLTVAKPGPVEPDDNADVDTPVAKAPVRARARRVSPPPEAPAPADSPVRITRAPLKVDPALMRGYEAFNRGELDLAQVEYERALKADPRNTDALHGLAAIAVRQGNAARADHLYQQITELNPQDTVAMSALINSRGQIDPNAAESRLKSLSASQPDLAAPHFSLGNLYARHGRWSDAQQSYFKAYSAEPDNPDILYNLAISLEHLRQNTLAAQYYSQALAAAQSRPAGFDTAQAASRLRSLRP
ncbi:MAG: tetratricopeptide repeat protein, partial [Sulfuritalea sp.]|nr:tetratricopeptide repeat protein [Sulfuritalea sp.]